MKLSEFKIGMEFEMSGQRWRCTDVGTRTIAAICLDDIPQDDPSWLNGPPYSARERRNELTALHVERKAVITTCAKLAPKNAAKRISTGSSINATT